VFSPRHSPWASRCVSWDCEAGLILATSAIT
jgi:hypothetical protein